MQCQQALTLESANLLQMALTYKLYMPCTSKLFIQVSTPIYFCVQSLGAVYNCTQDNASSNKLLNLTISKIS